MTDMFDLATEREEIARQDALEVQRRRAGLAGKTLADSALECIMCEEAILEERRSALPGVQTCTLCQGELERATRVSGRRYP